MKKNEKTGMSKDVPVFYENRRFSCENGRFPAREYENTDYNKDAGRRKELL